MPEIRFQIDKETGELRAHIKGVPGTACLDVQKLVEDLVGEAQETGYTAEFHQVAQVKSQGKIRQQ